MDGALAVPDGIEPITAYRFWSSVMEGRRASLHAVTCSGLEDCGWAPGRWVVARCGVGREHQAAHAGCSCGFYGVKSLGALFSAGPWPMPEGWVVGRVELAGPIVEHELGYRAGRARVAELIAPEDRAAQVIRLVNRLGLPMGPLLRGAWLRTRP